MSKPANQVTREQYERLVALAMSERTLQARVLELARRYGWRSYHTWSSRRSAKGFPDLVLCRPPRLLCVELKTMRGKVAPEQRLWLGDLGESGAETGVWRPDCLEMIERVLRGECRG